MSWRAELRLQCDYCPHWTDGVKPAATMPELRAEATKRVWERIRIDDTDMCPYCALERRGRDGLLKLG